MADIADLNDREFLQHCEDSCVEDTNTHTVELIARLLRLSNPDMHEEHAQNWEEVKHGTHTCKSQEILIHIMLARHRLWPTEFKLADNVNA